VSVPEVVKAANVEAPVTPSVPVTVVFFKAEAPVTVNAPPKVRAPVAVQVIR
jgi:hypothetical protein